MAQAQIDSKVEFFRGYKCVLSNFYRFNLKFEKNVFNSVEQAYQFKKASVYGDEDSQHRIILSLSLNAWRAWVIGKEIKVDNEWPQKRVEVRRELLKAKLEQLKCLNHQSRRCCLTSL